MITLKGVEKHYLSGGAELPVLRGVDLELVKGASAAIIGPSGSGKTTLLSVMGAMERADAGEIRVGREELASLNEAQAAAFRNRQLGFVFQQHHLLPQLTVLENVLVPRLAGAWEESAEETRERALALLERVGLAERLSHRPAALSGGEKQRVAVARALINEPELVLADEPTGALDGETAERVAELLLNLQKERETTLVVVTHD
ncbi:MAG: ABC transporter ATP-binding protein, partial [Verrucomicrobiales bacterium]